MSAAADEPAGSRPLQDRSDLLPKPAEPKTVGKAVADQVDELLRLIRSD